MSMGMVRKIDELGRVVIPKEMRRVLNIKTGSSVEMVINDEKEVVLKKFYEIDNVLNFASDLCDTIFDKLGLSNIICDEDKIVASKGIKDAKKYFDKIVSNKTNKFVDFDSDNKNIYIFSIKSDGYEIGRVGIFFKEIDENKLSKIELLVTFASMFLKGWLWKSNLLFMVQ